MNRVSLFDPIPASVTSAAKAGFRFTSRIIDRDGIAVQKARFAGVAFFSEHDTDANHLRLVGEHVNKASVRDLHKLLVVLSAHLHLLLPEGILPDNESSNAFLHH